MSDESSVAEPPQAIFNSLASTPALSVTAQSVTELSQLKKRSLGYGSLHHVIETVDALRNTVDTTAMPVSSQRVWASVLRSGSMAAQRFRDPRWIEWFTDAWCCALDIEDFDVLHDLCGDLCALQPHHVGEDIADLRARASVAGFAIANLTDDPVKHLISLARNADRLLWVGDIQAACNLLERHTVHTRVDAEGIPKPAQCLVLDSLCAVDFAMGKMDRALTTAKELQARSADMPIYQAHAQFHIGMVAVRRFNFTRAKICIENLNALSNELGSVDAAEEMRQMLRTAWNTGRAPNRTFPRRATESLHDVSILNDFRQALDQALRERQPGLAKVMPTFNRSPEYRKQSEDQ